MASSWLDAASKAECSRTDAQKADYDELILKAMAEQREMREVKKAPPIRAKISKAKRSIEAAAKYVNMQLHQLQTGGCVQSNVYRWRRRF